MTFDLFRLRPLNSNQVILRQCRHQSPALLHRPTWWIHWINELQPLIKWWMKFPECVYSVGGASLGFHAVDALAHSYLISGTLKSTTDGVINVQSWQSERDPCIIISGVHQGFVLELLFSPSVTSSFPMSSSFFLFTSDRQKLPFRCVQQKTSEGNGKKWLSLYLKSSDQSDPYLVSRGQVNSFMS